MQPFFMLRRQQFVRARDECGACEAGDVISSTSASRRGEGEEAASCWAAWRIVWSMVEAM
jgi:hypothetical protein